MSHSDAPIGQTLPRFRFRKSATLLAVPLVCGSFACSSNSTESSDPNNSIATGGKAATLTGGAPSSSGGTLAASTGGASNAATGGKSSVGPATGGTTSTPATGGAVSTGGTTTKATSAATGGATATTAATGGAPGVGGGPSTGGMPATGGKSATGGTVATGGAGSGGTQTGGSSAKATGGASSATGGTTSTSTGFMPCPTNGTVCNVMPVGDSITEGCCTAPMGGYRIELFRQATTNKKNMTFVGTLTNGPTTVDGKTFPQHHEGHGGWKISQIAGVIDAAITSSKPHIVLLKIGTNDINGNDNTATAPNRLASLIDQITKDVPNALLVVSSIIPSKTDGTNTAFRTYNAAIKTKVEAAAAAGKHVLFVDNYQAFADNTNFKTAYMSDNLHPNDAGYVVLGKSWYGVIGAVLPAAP